MKTDILIIGGGLSGLALAYRLHQAGRDFQLIEARNRFGGRILSEASKKGSRFDLGPAWFWPGQPRILDLLSKLDIGYFTQYSKGNLVFQDQSGNIRRDINMATMEGAYRVRNGQQSIIDALVERLPQTCLQLNQQAHSITAIDEGAKVNLSDGEMEVNKAVLCLPPRLAAANIQFTPALDNNLSHKLTGTPTWMAAHAKFIAIYDAPFWREMGLSGDGISHIGPMVELHDASPDAPARDGAIFGFLGVPAEARKGQKDEIIQACTRQLITLFGEKAANPIDTFYEDWSEETLTATDADANSPQSHPHYHSIPIHDDIWRNRLIISGTETAPQFGGFLEGALEAGENAIHQL
ncbi:flavin monoamine oxidase family protein [Lentilitoribacter sp. EG35]|uniref:flavin monoamine oxidase family protein n=1 Tax=Lentilitoribacter sp. EG35 TaxID=3234192 RepID=UPI0034602D53